MVTHITTARVKWTYINYMKIVQFTVYWGCSRSNIHIHNEGIKRSLEKSTSDL